MTEAVTGWPWDDAAICLITGSTRRLGREVASGADLAAARAVMETNLFGAWTTTQAFLPLLRRSAHPRVVTMGSGAGSPGDEQFGLTARGGAATLSDDGPRGGFCRDGSPEPW